MTTNTAKVGEARSPVNKNKQNEEKQTNKQQTEAVSQSEKLLFCSKSKSTSGQVRLKSPDVFLCDVFTHFMKDASIGDLSRQCIPECILQQQTELMAEQKGVKDKVITSFLND